MFKKILVGLSIGLVGLLNTGLAYAVFSDNANVTGNTISTSTLYFNLTDSGGDQIFYPLFFSSDLTPGSSKSATFKINKEGTENFKYNIGFSKTSGDDNLCVALNLKVKIDGSNVYDGSLSGLAITPVSISDGMDDLELNISLSDSSADLTSKSCSFDFTIKGWQENSDGSWGFSDSHSLSNNLSTTTWETLTLAPDNATSGDPIQSGELDSGPTAPDNSPSDNDNITPTPTPTVSSTPTPGINLDENIDSPTPSSDSATL